VSENFSRIGQEMTSINLKKKSHFYSPRNEKNGFHGKEGIKQLYEKYYFRTFCIVSENFNKIGQEMISE
jgi:hypothetical protein